MGIACSCFEGPCAISRIPIPRSPETVRLDSLPLSPLEVVDIPRSRESESKTNLDASTICDTSAESHTVTSPMSNISASRSELSEANRLFRIQNLYWLRDSQRILSRDSKLPPQIPVTGDSEDSHW